MNVTRAFLESVAAVHGSRFYLVDTSLFKRNFERLRSAFRSNYTNVQIAYSYKTNYLPRFCEIVLELGGYAEVVSSMEMKLAEKIGVPADRIFFNGPYKTEKYSEHLLRAGGTVNVDSWDELQKIARIAVHNHDSPFKVGLRCNFDVQDGIISRFGFDVNDGVFEQALSLIDKHPGLEVAGLHCHFSTRTLECWKNRAAGMIEVIQRHFSNRLQDLKHVSLGGGMYGAMPEDLRKQFAANIPTFQEYADAAALPFAKYFESSGQPFRPELIIEPGTALAADAMRYICRVNSIKDVRGESVVSMTGSAYDINPNPNRINPPIDCFPVPSVQRKQLAGANLTGYTCIEGDVLYRGFDGALGVGDFVSFDCVGSYSVVMKPPFILPGSAIVEQLDSKNAWRALRRNETFDDVFAAYHFS